MARRVADHSPEDIEKAPRAGQWAAEVLSMIEPLVVPGVSTDRLDQIRHDHIVNVQGSHRPTSATRVIPKPSSPP